MVSIRLLLLVGIVSTCQAAFLFGGPAWNDLVVTWTINPFGGFNALPRTVSAAASAGFTMVSDCGAHNSFSGKRYVKGGDYAVVLLYDMNGYIAGIQMGIPKDANSNFPPAKQINHPFVLDGNMYFVTAYFTNPATICTDGRTSAQYTNSGTGTALIIQNGTDPSSTNLLTIPMTESAIHSTRWTRGHCFPSMGVHYWYDIKADMNCDDFFPVFLLFNHGKLNGFGWAMGEQLSSARLEHPAYSVVGQFINPVPTCLEHKSMSTLHIYLTSHPHLDICI